MTFLAFVACQAGTALAARTHHSSLRAVGLFTNTLLWWGILLEAVFAAALVALPPAQEVFGTAVPTAWQLATLLPLPFAVWSADEAWRWARRRAEGRMPR